ncbi:MAG: UDP-N-acetylmuramoyl-tripeptide--D-alanyl-D-alanine ligase [Puniceicoccales bacterium]|jgi:UDP-N-acetylmuramoyl-tripeptide--D-alanyl-D-alanine ligase|nr:UDP-N-acetylmuramoyl-tripeptide--D-alanyl-D-alanine ligase [Puniceicoccales bacterium]
MSRFSPEQLQVWSGGRWLNDIVPLLISGFCNDTRSVSSGDCFVALKTSQRDGHAYLGDAVAKGAVAALVSRPDPSILLPQLVVVNVLESLQRIARHWRERFRSPVFGVTGSVGKTSTKDLLKMVLGENSFVTEANLNNLLGVPLMLLRIDPALHFSGAVIEAGMSEPGELARSAWMIQPDIAVITNVQPVHLAGVGSLEKIAWEKSAMARQTSAQGVSVFPASCLKFAAFRELLGRTVPVVFPDEEIAEGHRHEQVFYANFSDKSVGRTIQINSNDGIAGKFDFPESTLGMARNAAIAAVASMLAGVSEERIQAAFSRWRPSARRGEVVTCEGRIFYVDCYNASPASMIDAAREFDKLTAEAPRGRMFVLAGMNELGEQSVTLHESVGSQLPLRKDDSLILFGGDSASIGNGAVSAGFFPGSVRLLGTIEEVRAAINDFQGPVLLKGSRSYALERVLPVELQGKH